MTMHMSAEPNAAPLARLAEKLGLPPGASRGDVAEAFFDLREAQQEKLHKTIKKGINGKNTLLAAFESRAVREPEALARVLDTLPGVTDFQSVALAMIGAVEGMRSYRKQIAAAGNFDAKAEVLVDLDRAIAMLSKEGLLTTPTTSSASSSSASTSAAATAPSAPPRPNASHANLSRATVEEARRRGVDPNRVADTLRAILRRGES